MEITIPYQFDPRQRPHQLEILRNKARFKSLIIHRKAGKTALALNKLILESQLNPNKVFWYVAPTYKQAKEIVWKDPEMLSKYLPMEIVDRKNDTELTIYFKNGSVLSVKGADEPDSLRGPNPFLTILDEFPLHKPAIWEEIISPIAFANPLAQVWFVGTPKPTGSYAQQLHEKAKVTPNWFAFELSAEHSGILSPETLEEARQTMTQTAFEQEFMCKWFTDGGVVFRGIDQCIDPNVKLLDAHDQRFRYQFGIDLAMHVDWTVAVGINKQRHWVEIFDRYNQIDYNLQKARIEAMLRRHGNAFANMDQTGVGEPVVQDLQMRGLQVNGIQITAPMKYNLITNLAMMIEQRKIKFPDPVKYPEIAPLIEELKIFGYEVNEKTRRISYGAPEGRHDDCVLALALACWELGSKLSGVAPEDVQKRGKVKFQFS